MFHFVCSVRWPAIRSVWKHLPFSAVIRSSRAGFTSLALTSRRRLRTVKTASPSSYGSVHQKSRTERSTLRYFSSNMRPKILKLKYKQGILGIVFIKLLIFKEDFVATEVFFLVKSKQIQNTGSEYNKLYMSLL